MAFEHAQVVRFDFARGVLVHAEFYPQWDGEDATFDVTDLSGIDIASGLTDVSLSLANFDAVCVDVSPLAKLLKLERLELRGPVRGLASLEVLGGTLREVTLDEQPDAETARVLRASGIAVRTRSESAVREQAHDGEA